MAVVVCHDDKGLLTAILTSEHTPDWEGKPNVLINPELPRKGDSKHWIVEGGIIRQMTGDEILIHLTQPAEVRRARSYPPIEEQLDALYHDMEQGLMPKSPKFFDMIKKIKDAIPKDL